MIKTKAKVVSAVNLSARQISALEKVLTKKLDKQVEISPETDASLIGGFYVHVDGLVIDSSVKKQISDMKESITKGVL